MKRLENIELIKCIVMKPTACVKCQIGQDWFQCDFEVRFVPDKYYPDYMEVQDFIMQEIDGKELNIEQAVKILYDYLIKYEPKELIITNHVCGCKTHFDVDVII